MPPNLPQYEKAQANHTQKLCEKDGESAQVTDMFDDSSHKPSDCNHKNDPKKQSATELSTQTR